MARKTRVFVGQLPGSGLLRTPRACIAAMCAEGSMDRSGAATNSENAQLNTAIGLAWSAYTMSKYGMSMCVLGMASEFQKEGISVNALWPQTAIATSAVKNLPGGDQIALHSRTPLIMADAAYEILKAPKGELTGNFFIDEALLKSKGVNDFTKYQIDPNKNLYPDLFID